VPVEQELLHGSVSVVLRRSGLSPKTQLVNHSEDPVVQIVELGHGRPMICLPKDPVISIIVDGSVEALGSADFTASDVDDTPTHEEKEGADRVGNLMEFGLLRKLFGGVADGVGELMGIHGVMTEGDGHESGVELLGDGFADSGGIPGGVEDLGEGAVKEAVVVHRLHCEGRCGGPIPLEYSGISTPGCRCSAGQGNSTTSLDHGLNLVPNLHGIVQLERDSAWGSADGFAPSPALRFEFGKDTKQSTISQQGIGRGDITAADTDASG